MMITRKVKAKTSCRAKILLLVASLVTSTLVLETFIRVTRIGYTAPPPDVAELFANSKTLEKKKIRQKAAPSSNAFYEFDSELGWRIKPFSEKLAAEYADFDKVTINSIGGFDHEPDFNKELVLVLGDSFVENLAVQIQNQFPTLLENKFPKYEFLNLGVSGYGSVQAYLKYKGFRRLHKTARIKHVIFAVFFGNDLKDNSFHSNTTMRGVPGRVRDSVPFWRNGQVVYGKDARVRLGEINMALRRSSQVYSLCHRALISFGFIRESGADIIEKVAWALKKLLEKEGTGLTVLLIPHDGFLAYGVPRAHDDILQFLLDKKIHTVSLAEPFIATGRTTMGFLDEKGRLLDQHWDNKTNALVAKILSYELLNKL